MTPIYTDPNGKRWRILEDGIPRVPQTGDHCVTGNGKVIHQGKDDIMGAVTTIVEPITPTRLIFEECADSPRTHIAPREWWIDPIDNCLTPYREGFGTSIGETARIFRLIEGEI